MFENPRRDRQARNFTTNVPKILDLKSSSEQIFFRKLSLGAPGFYSEPSLRRPILRWHSNEPWPRYFSVAIVFARQQWNLRRQLRNFTRSFFLYDRHPKSCGQITEVGCEVKMNIPSLSVLSREKTVWSGLDRQMLVCLLLLFSFVMTQFKTLDCLHEPQAMYLGNRY